MFGKGNSPELEKMVDSLARSYMRGSVFETPTARAGLVSDMHALADKLRRAGNSKAVDKARNYQPGFFMGLPSAARGDFQRLIASALG